MHEKLNEQIRLAQNDLARQQLLKNAIIALKQEKEPFEQKARALYETHQEENLDVEKLQKMSFKKAIYTLLSQLVERTEKEKKEAFAAKLKFDLAKSELDDIQQRIDTQRKELAKLADCQKEYERLYTEKKELLMQRSPQTAQMLMDKSQQLNKSILTRKGAQKALDVSKQVLESLREAAFYLYKAQAWATWGSSRSGIIKSIKESFLEDTQKAIFSASRSLRSFNETLSAIGISTRVSIEPIYFDSDSLYEEFFYRSSEGNKMESAEDSIGLARARMYTAVKSLNKLLDTAATGSEQLRAELDSVILDGVNN